MFDFEMKAKIDNCVFIYIYIFVFYFFLVYYNFFSNLFGKIHASNF